MALLTVVYANSEEQCSTAVVIIGSIMFYRCSVMQ